MPDIEVTIVEATPINVEITKTGPPGGGPGGGAVDSVFGRTGVVVAQNNDYDDTQIAVDDTDLSAATDGAVTGSNVHAILLSLLVNFAITITNIWASISSKFDKVTDTLDDIIAGTTNKHFTDTEKTKLSGIEAGAEVNNISDANATDLTDGGTTTLHSHTVTKSDVGLSDVDNTSDTNKPVSTAQQTAIDDKVAKANLYGSVGYRPKGLTNWFTALKNAKTTPANIVVIGDSIAVLNVYGSTAPWTWRLAQLMADKGRTTTDPTHLRYPKPTGNQAPYMTSCQGTLTSPVSGMGAQAVDLTNGQTATQTATMDGISIIYTTKPGNGSLQIRDGVGGTLLATINTDAALKSSNVWTSNALTLASHTIEITSVGNTIFEGVYVHNGTRAKGVRVWSASISGYTSQQMASTPSFALDLISNINPDLVIIATGTNDGAANYATYMGNLISAVQGVHDGDIALWFPYPSSAGFPTSEEDPARTYMDTLTIPVIDAGVGCANISTLYSADGIHPTDLGHSMLANQVYSFIGGDPIGEMAFRRSIVENNLTTLDTLKAPKATPTFTGLSTFETLSAVLGNFTVNSFFGYPYTGIKETGNTYNQIQAGPAALNNALYTFNGAGWLLGTGSAAGDTPLWRAGVNRMQIGLDATPGTLAANLSPIINAQTGTTYTLALGDAGKTITRSNSAASTQTFPQNSGAAIPIGTIINIINLGTGLLSFAAGSGATITGAVSIRQYQRAMAVKTATNTWNITAPELNRSVAIPPTSGDYYSMGGLAGAGTAGLTTAGKLILHPLWLDAGTLDRIAVSTSVAAVSTYRLGLYKANPVTGLPDGQTPFLDAGTVDMNATAGVQAITISKDITEPGLYWAAILVDAYTAQPTTHNVVYSSASGSGILGLPQDMSSLGRFRVGRTYGSTVATGSLPTVPTSSMSWAGTAPRVAVRYV